MYIKIKHIKFFLLLVACFSLAGFNYLNYATADDNTDRNVCNKNIDADCDGLTDAEEKLYGTDLNSADTDKDGYSDGVEIRSGYDPLKPAPGDKIETGKSSSLPDENVANAPNLTDEYFQNLNGYLSLKEGQSVSTADIDSFIDEEFSKKIGDNITIASLPDIDQSQIKILKQDYSRLNDTDKKKRESEDAMRYFVQMAYLIASNMPNQMLSVSDFSKFEEEFSSRLVNLANSSEDDIKYFSDLGNRLEAFLNQADDVQVPETMLEIHVKFFRIARGILTLREYSFDENDPLGNLILMDKIRAYTELLGNFFNNDLRSYFKQLGVI